MTWVVFTLDETGKAKGIREDRRNANKLERSYLMRLWNTSDIDGGTLLQRVEDEDSDMSYVVRWRVPWRRGKGRKGAVMFPTIPTSRPAFLRASRMLDVAGVGSLYSVRLGPNRLSSGYSCFSHTLAHSLHSRPMLEYCSLPLWMFSCNLARKTFE